ncbi:MAG: ornithine cyclodeaminase family protein [Rhizobiaceae bacterium]
MKFFPAADMEALGDWEDLTRWLFESHRSAKPQLKDLLLQQEGNAWFTRTAWADNGDLGLKSVTVFPSNMERDPPRPSINGAFLLFDGTTGETEAVLDGAALTIWKTIGDSVLGARLLARRSSRSLLVVGSGTIASRISTAYLSVFSEIEKVQIWNRTAEKAEALATKLSNELSVDVKAVEDLEGAAGEADIITSATMSVDPVIYGSWVKPGTHIDLIGAYRVDMREADDELLRKGRLFVDMRESTIGEIGELIIPMQAGVITESDVLADYYDLAKGELECRRQSDDEITIFKNGGGAHLDLMTAKFFFSRSQNVS